MSTNFINKRVQFTSTYQPTSILTSFSHKLLRLKTFTVDPSTETNQCIRRDIDTQIHW